MPEVDTLDELNERIKSWEAADEKRRTTGHANTIGEDFDAERPLLRPLPAEGFDSGVVLHARVDRSAMIRVRMVKHSVAAHSPTTAPSSKPAATPTTSPTLAAGTTHQIARTQGSICGRQWSELDGG